MVFQTMERLIFCIIKTTFICPQIIISITTHAENRKSYSLEILAVIPISVNIIFHSKPHVEGMQNRTRGESQDNSICTVGLSLKHFHRQLVQRVVQQSGDCCTETSETEQSPKMFCGEGDSDEGSVKGINEAPVYGVKDVLRVVPPDVKR